VKVGLLSLGCARNLVDSEVALGGLLKQGYEYEPDISKADVALVNTCGFTEDAKNESIDAILELAELKKTKQIKALVVMGCLSQRYGEKLSEELKEVDAILGVSNFAEIAKILEPLRKSQKVYDVPQRPRFILDQYSPRKRMTPKHYAYVKISEGCINACST